MKSMTVAALFAALSLGACQPGETDRTDPAAADAAEASADAAASGAAPTNYGMLIDVDREGLRFADPESGATHLAAFDGSREDTLAAVSGALGFDGVESSEPECPSGATAGPVQYVAYDGGLTLLFIDGAFAGWTADGQNYSLMNGVAPGSSRAEAEEGGARFEQTSLGLEGDIDGVGVMLDEAGQSVSLLYAGDNCFAR